MSADAPDYCQSFAPVVAAGAEILILGSMPGVESLRMAQYYAFKHNAFWRIVADIYQFDFQLPYPARVAALTRNHVALWDVLGGCKRTGSLDSAIVQPCPNDIAGLLRQYPTLRKICCNGGASARFLHRFFPDLPLTAVQLPSTSPAAASWSYERKLAAWREALRG